MDNYDGNPSSFTVNQFFRDDKVGHERIYIMDGWKAAEWREHWRSSTLADPPAPELSSWTQRQWTGPTISVGASFVCLAERTNQQ